MAMTLVGTTTVGSGGASNVQFTNIPQTGKDLLVLVSCRSSSTSAQITMAVYINDVVTFTYNARSLRGTGSSASSQNVTGDNNVTYSRMTGAGATSNTFNNNAYYFANYAGSSIKTVSIDAVNENNDTAAQQTLVAANLDTTAITKLEFGDPTANLFVENSTFSLYIIS